MILIQVVGWKGVLMNSEGQLNWLSEREECLAVILTYCEFAQDQRVCFLNLETKYGDLGSNLLSGLPKTIEAESPQAEFYISRLETLREIDTSVECKDYSSKEYCSAHVAIQKYLAASSLTAWLAELEGEQQ